MKFSVLIILLITFHVVISRPGKVNFLNQRAGCGYESCHPIDENVLNVHLVPHSHDDVGWLKTVDQYYYGSRTSTQRAGVQYILDSVIDELWKDPVRRFVYVESAFFEKWWLEQTEEKKDQVKQLVSEGRLEFAGGAWSMNDEATVHYQSIIDQLTWGFRFLNDTFGECGRPRAGWQIDPFGHSRELANIWALSGFDGLLLGRIDFQDKFARENAKEMEMIWRGSDDLGAPSDILTGVLFNRYSPPPGFCFDVLCSDDPVIDDINSPDYNVDNMVERFLTYAQTQASNYKTNNIIMTMGDDFFYQDARMWYKNLDKLIKYINERQNTVKLIYSTPACYIKSLHESNTSWPTKQDDFFPYGSDFHAYWTGYFTSRPTIKYYERSGNNLLQICKQLQAMTDSSDELGLSALRGAMGVMQHHDAITGTEKQHVANDYSRILELGIQDCNKITEKALNKLANSATYLEMEICPLNITACDISEYAEQFIVTIYNPTGFYINETIRLPAISEYYRIREQTEIVLDHYVMPIPEHFLQQFITRKSNATKELIFEIQNIPPLGFKSVHVENMGDLNNAVETKEKPKKPDKDIIQNEFLTVTIDILTGLIDRITYIEGNETITFPIIQELMYYEGWNGNNNVTTNRASGAYVFRPNSSEAKSFGHPKISSYGNNFVEELYQEFSSWATQIVRLYKGQKYVEFEWLIGPIPIDDDMGKEVISRFSTDFVTDNTFYTDSNGRQMLKRILNQRPTWDVNLEEPVSGNYYPITTMMGLKDIDSNREIYLLTDRAQGGTSLVDGQIELMVHRRLLHDDAFGVGEALNESENGIGLIVVGKHYLVVGDSNQNPSPIAQSRHLAITKQVQPTVFFSKTDITFEEWLTYKHEHQSLVGELPGNVRLLTLEPWKDGTILLRLEHYLQKEDDPLLSSTVTIDLENLFNELTITSLKEVTLAANQWIDEVERLKWKSSKNMAENFNEIYHKGCLFSADDKKSCHINERLLYTQKIPHQSSDSDHIKDQNTKAISVTLEPMEIKTFIITVTPSSKK